MHLETPDVQQPHVHLTIALLTPVLEDAYTKFVAIYMFFKRCID